MSEASVAILEYKQIKNVTRLGCTNLQWSYQKDLLLTHITLFLNTKLRNYQIVDGYYNLNENNKYKIK